MQIKIFLISTLFSWNAYDPNLFRRRGTYISTAIEISYSLKEEQQQQKKIKRDRLDVIPHWHRGKKQFQKPRMNYFSTKPRDVRFSDQRKIRRMFNGC